MIRIHKKLSTNPSLGWVNSYEYVAAEDAEYGDTIGLVNQLIAMEQAIHQVDVVFGKYVISTWVEDGAPYNPSSFVSVTLVGLVGLNTNGAPMSLHNCLKVKRAVGMGREGTILYRRVLGEGDVSSVAGDLVVSPAALATYTALIEDSTTSMAMEPYFTGLSSAVGYLAMIGDVDEVRPITSLAAAGGSVVKYNHRYFNRA